MIAKKQPKRMGRPPLNEGVNMHQIAVRLPEPILVTIDEFLAGRLDAKNRSDMIRELLAEAIEARKAKGKK
jgi:metal-responsive CopG/Arc/MetJ family transcriptional regulator